MLILSLLAAATATFVGTASASEAARVEEVDGP
jgi:hypothetical protein